MRYIIIIIISLLCFTTIFAQKGKDTVTNKQVTVGQFYKATLIEANKIESVPVIEKPSPSAPNYTYTILPKQSKTDKIVNPIPAADLFKKEENIFPTSFVKLGYGNLRTPLAEIYLNNKQSNQYSYGMQYRFLQTNSNLNRSLADFTDHALKAYMATYTTSGEFGLEVNYKNNKYNYYGFVDSINLDSNQGLKNKMARNIQNFEAKAYFNSTPSKNSKVKHRTAFNYYNFQIGGAKEADYALLSKIYGNIGDFNDMENGVLSATIGLDYTTLQLPGGKSRNRFFIQLDPRYDFKYDVINLSVGFNSTILFDGNDSAQVKPNLFVKATYPLIEGVANLYGGIDGRYRKQSLKSIIQANQFTSTYNLTNQYETVKVFAGINGKIGSSMDASFEINYSDVAGMPLFISKRDSLNSFGMVVENLSILKFSAALNYSFSEKARIGLIGNFYNYNTSSQAEAWQLPTIEGKLNMSFNINNKIYPHFDVVAMSMQPQRTGVLENSYSRGQIKAFYDISTGIDFRFRPKLSLFVQANNLMSSRYQRWYNYPVYGFNILGGLTFIF
ncbi:MAG: hypothetical protein PSX81_09230 [bacterium]|nr:hypothetical protein [bacterium]